MSHDMPNLAFKNPVNPIKPTGSFRSGAPLVTALEPRFLLDISTKGTAVSIPLLEAARDIPVNQAETSQKPCTKQAPYAAREVRPLDPAKNYGRKDVAFIDKHIPGYQTLISSMGAGIEVVLIDSPPHDHCISLTQVVQWACQNNGYDAVHVFCHSQHRFTDLYAHTHMTGLLSGYTLTLEVLSQSLSPEGSILLYGCKADKLNPQEPSIDFMGQLSPVDSQIADSQTGMLIMHADWSFERFIQLPMPCSPQRAYAEARTE